MEAAMMGTIVTSNVNNQTTSLQLSLSVLLSCASSMVNLPRLGLFDGTHGLVQVVAENFDTGISSQNGQKSTHESTTIITQSGQPKQKMSSKIKEILTIKHLKWKQTKANLLLDTGRGETGEYTSCYHGSKKPDMPK